MYHVNDVESPVKRWYLCVVEDNGCIRASKVNPTTTLAVGGEPSPHAIGHGTVSTL